ncbi:hypothetical protein TVAG_071850 [Trichomonas vaginalis G3]|uniref:Uncharacterized protein n=1 Tax=Trichomonas vaginalis (strain ATCC PRA-98 / G3) TaxID=412133 RepID=A2D888_TRIV3|nr:glycoprotein 38 family [Trichomonas vaginalis G3]EAY23521.1 hypothetical protein TVAG_071850 [Trichomonas vaginalis G3]KAI5493943.1 glycoprotein 38 family [Trichomonas vaginalis G3]|eukprot:XP_001584507.1 hypothetical protein [Trichomonas vaginalis G3]
MLSNIIALSLMKTHERLSASVRIPRESNIDINNYIDKINGCTQSNIIDLTDDKDTSMHLYHIEEGQYICLVGGIFIGSDSEIIGLVGFPDNEYNFEYTNPIQNPLVSVGKVDNLDLNTKYPMTRINCKDTTKSCAIQALKLPPPCYMNVTDSDMGPVEFSHKVVLDTKRQGSHTFKEYVIEKSDGAKYFLTTAVLISKSSRKFEFSKPDDLDIESNPDQFLDTYTNKTMSNKCIYTIELTSIDKTEGIKELNFRYDEIPDTETKEPFLFREDLSLTLPTKYGLYTIENASQLCPLDPDLPSPTPSPKPT